jgi:hypothetical protein
VELDTLARKSVLDDVAEELDDHVGDTNNPHDVSLQQAATQQGAVNTTLPGELYKGTAETANKLLSQGEVDERITTYVQGNPLYMGQLKYGADTETSMNAITGMSENDFCGVQASQSSYKYGHLITDGGLGYAAGDIVETDDPGVFVEVTKIGTDGVITDVVSSAESTATGSGTGADIAADLTWNVQPHGQDAVGQYYDLVHWYGVWDGASFAGEVSARITCRDAVAPIWDLIVHVDLLADGEVADIKMADTVTDGTETEPDFSDTTPKGFALFKQMVWRGINWLKNHAGKVGSVDGVEPDGSKDVPLTEVMDQADFAALEDPVGSGKYPSLKGKNVVLNDVYPNNIIRASPDYSRMTDNVVPSPTSPLTGTAPLAWRSDYYTCPEDGYILAGCYFRSDAGNCYTQIQCIGSRTGYLDFNGGVPAGGQDQHFEKDLVPVSKGDQVRYCVYGDAATSITMSAFDFKFIPLKYRVEPAPQVVVEQGNDYSLTEQPVLIWDPVLQASRPKLWVDGKPIFERSFTGTTAGAANTDIRVNLATGVSDIVTEGGFWEMGLQIKIPLGSNNTTNTVVSHTGVGADNVLYFVTKSNTERTASPYSIWVQYTKI